MPLYEYKCEDCGESIEIIQKFSDPPLSTCTQCGGNMKKVIFPSGLIFKGSGWYITDYSSKGKKEEGKKEGKKDKNKEKVEAKK